MKKFILCLLLIAAIVPVFCFAKYYDSGDSCFCIRLGSDFPMLVSFPNADEGEKLYTGFGTAEDKIGLSAGITGSLSYVAFLNSDFAVGGELGYILNFTRIDQHFFTEVPITAKVSYYPVQTGKFDLVVNANLGYNYVKFMNSSDVTGSCSSLYASVTLAPTYYFGSSWGLGLEGGASCMFELHTKSKRDANAIMLKVPASLVISYRH